MKHRFTRWWAIAGLVILLALILPAPVWAHGPAEGGAEESTIRWLFIVTLAIATPIFLLVEGLLLFAIFRYKRRSDDEMPEQIHGNTKLELGWTVGSFVIIAIVFAFTAYAMMNGYKAEADQDDTTPDYTIRVTGYMFTWDYAYFRGDAEADNSATGVMTTRDLYVPADRNVLLEITSTDVNHSFWVPDLAGKVDAIPGYVNTMWLTADDTGTYHGQCAEFCGTNHYNMLIDVHVMAPDEFETWLGEQEAAMTGFQPIMTDMETPLPEGDAERGEGIFNELGCHACHQWQDSTSSGPAVERMAEDAENEDDAIYYLRESIQLPCERLAEGYDYCVMSQDYGERLDAQMLADLIQYLLDY
jgi:cytochrome c oxidase subunit II